jgi:hypothetical protein
MRTASIKPLATAAALGFMVAGCATSWDVGPGYYRYDSHVVGAAPASTTVVRTEPATVIAPAAPAVVYREPATVIAPVNTANAPPPSLTPEPAAPPSTATAITDTTPSGTYTPGVTVIKPGTTVYQYREPVVVYHAPDTVWNLSPSYTDRPRGQ